jgi:predicted ribosome quality control (RQC) complex YloA/Tae2 family protein
MDNFLLEAAIRELRREAVGLAVHRVVAEGPDRLMLLLGEGWGAGDAGPPRRRLHVGLEPAGARFHLSRRRAAPAPPSPFQALLGREIAGAVLRDVRKPLWERVAVLELHRDPIVRRLAVEMLGSRPNLWLLDGEDRVLGYARPGGGKRAPAPGERWVPPEAGDRLDPESVGEAEFRELALAPEGLGRRLARRLQGMSPAVADDLQRRTEAGEDPWPPFRAAIEAMRDGRFDPHLYEAVPATPAPGPRAFAAPFPLFAPGVAGRRFGSASELLDALGEIADRESTLAVRRASLGAALAREIDRLCRLESLLAADLAREGEAEEHVRRGTILLAGLTAARVEGDRVTLPDPFDPEGRDVTLTIDPRRSLPENAERLFRLARKARRGRATVERRLAEARSRLPGLEAAARDLPAAAALDDVVRIEEDLAARGLLRLVRRRARRAERAAARRSEVLPIRAYRSADGLEILVGRSGKDNETLTFGVAQPHDFWLHAEGFAGAHVVVRNPERRKRLPAATLDQAARIAAFHSKARGAGRVEVIVTQRRHVKRGRNLPPGTVRVQRHESVQAVPEMPFPEEV